MRSNIQDTHSPKRILKINILSEKCLHHQQLLPTSWETSPQCLLASLALLYRALRSTILRVERTERLRKLGERRDHIIPSHSRNKIDCTNPLGISSMPYCLDLIFLNGDTVFDRTQLLNKVKQDSVWA